MSFFEKIWKRKKDDQGKKALERTTEAEEVTKAEELGYSGKNGDQQTF